MYSLDHGRFTVAAGACGVVRACLERSSSTPASGRPLASEIGRYQFVQDMIATMVLGYETSKLLVMQAAWNEGSEPSLDARDVARQWHATESALRRRTRRAGVGSYGYAAESGSSATSGNARAPIIYEGTTQIHKMMQAEHALAIAS